MASLTSGALQQFQCRLAVPSAVCTTESTDVPFTLRAEDSSLPSLSLRKGLPVTLHTRSLGFRLGTTCGRRLLDLGCRYSASSSTTVEPAVCYAPTGMKRTTLYDVLGISDMVTDDEIKAAFRRIAKELHPDQAPPNQVQEYQKKFMEVHKAYSVLKDPRTRSMYNYEIRNSVYSKAIKVEDWKRPPWRGCNWETDQCWTS